MPTTLILAPPDFQTFLRPCICFVTGCSEKDCFKIGGNGNKGKLCTLNISLACAVRILRQTTNCNLAQYCLTSYIKLYVPSTL